MIWSCFGRMNYRIKLAIWFTLSAALMGPSIASANPFFVVAAIILICINFPLPKPESETAKRKKRQYICCAPVVWVTDNDDEYECWFHLYEDEDGLRTAEYAAQPRQDVPNPQQFGERHVVFNKIIRPWIGGLITTEELLAYFKIKETRSPNPPSGNTEIIDLSRFRR